MIKIEKTLKKIKESNLIYLIEKKSDLKLFKELNLVVIYNNKAILNKIENTFNEWKNTHLDFFIWDNTFENITVIFYLDDSLKTLLEYSSDVFRNYKNNNFTIHSKNNDSLLKMIDMSVLVRYKYNDYKTDKESKKKDDILVLVTEDNINKIITLWKNKAKKDIKIKDLYTLLVSRIKTLENIIIARDLWSMPSNELFPESFSAIVKKTKFKNTKVKIFDYKKIQKLGLWLIEAVGKWSIHKPNMVVLERIIDKKLPTIWLVWKWITFDTGWIQVKPWDHMYEMKWDMCGAAQVFSIMKELDEKNLKVNIVASLVLAENHISSEAYKPSDIIKSYSGNTVDIVHTDAEWRLVLADWISYISKNYKLEKIISIATLTWACMVALGFRYAWIMWTDDKLISSFLKYSDKNFEKYNRLPFDKYFVEKTKSEIADFENLNRWVYAWSTMWAAFLSNFLLNNEKYTHIDIAWTALNSFEPYWLSNKWMTWFWVDSISSVIWNLDLIKK
jgi:leucyl aminopeptidase